MASSFARLAAISTLGWALAIAATAAQPSARAVQKTTNDAIFSKAQADGAKAQYDKLCADCHSFTAAAKKKPTDVALGGDEFFENWEGRTVGEMITTIALTMPNDGSAVVSDTEAANLVAYILQRNGAPAGAKALTKEQGAAVVARPKK